jgi:hypothetical protein
VDSYVVGSQGSHSVALDDHKAFLFSKDKNLLVVPATLNENAAPSPDCLPGAYCPVKNSYFSGALVLRVDEKGFELKGRIEHGDKGDVGIQDCWWGYCYYDNNVLRSLYIGDTLYTYSNKYLKANDLTDLKEIKSLELKKEKKGDDFIIVN